MQITEVTIKDHVPSVKNNPAFCVKIVSLLPDAPLRSLYELW